MARLTKYSLLINSNKIMLVIEVVWITKTIRIEWTTVVQIQTLRKGSSEEELITRSNKKEVQHLCCIKREIRLREGLDRRKREIRIRVKLCNLQAVTLLINRMQTLLTTLTRMKRPKIKMILWKSSMKKITKIKVSNTTMKPLMNKITITTMITRQIMHHRIISKMQQTIIMILKRSLQQIILKAITW